MTPTHPALVRAGAAVAAVAAAALFTACSGPSAPPPAHPPAPPSPAAANPAAASGFTATPQATGKLPNLPPGALYVEIEQVGAGPVPSGPLTRDCILRTQNGAQPLLDHAGAPTTAPAAFLGPDGGSFPKTGTTMPATVFCLRPATDRTTGKTVVPGAKTVFASGDFTDLTGPGPYTASLQLVTIQPAGHGPAHQHPGPETILGMTSTTTYRLGGPTPVTYNGQPSPITVTPGQAFTHKPAQPIQDINNTTGVTQVLVFQVAPANQPPRQDLPTPP